MSNKNSIIRSRSPIPTLPAEGRPRHCGTFLFPWWTAISRRCWIRLNSSDMSSRMTSSVESSCPWRRGRPRCGEIVLGSMIWLSARPVRMRMWGYRMNRRIYWTCPTVGSSIRRMLMRLASSREKYRCWGRKISNWKPATRRSWRACKSKRIVFKSS